MNTALLTIDDFSSKNTPAIVDYLKEKVTIPIAVMVKKASLNLKHRLMTLKKLNLKQRVRSLLMRIFLREEFPKTTRYTPDRAEHIICMQREILPIRW